MRTFLLRVTFRLLLLSIFAAGLVQPASVLAADKLNLIYTARVMSQSYPWIAQEAGLFKKYDLDVPLVFVTPGAGGGDDSVWR